MTEKSLLAKIEKIVIQEFKKGKSPAQIIAMARKAGISETDIKQTFVKISKQPQSPIAPLLPMISNFLQTKKKQSTDQKSTPKKRIWDPLSSGVKIKHLSTKQEKIRKLLKKWQQNPNRLKINMFLMFLPLIILTGLGFVDHDTAIWVWGGEDDRGGVWEFLLAPPLYYYWRIRSVQIDMIKIQLAERLKWMYDPSINSHKAAIIINKFPEIFTMKGSLHAIEDQFWGQIQQQNFWSGVFSFKRRKKLGNTIAMYILKKINQESIARMGSTHMHFVAYELPIVATGRLFIAPSTSSRGKKAKTEYELFNKNFRISFTKDNKEQDGLETIKAFSPLVLTKFVDVLNKYGKFFALATDRVIIFVFADRMLSGMRTSFLSRGVKIDPKDVQKLEHKMNSLLVLTKGITSVIR